jgi:hypothetical protein
MRKLTCILLLLLSFACNKDDDPKKLTSIAGNWLVITPDDATTISFRIGKDSDGEYVVESSTVRHNGGVNSQPIDARIVTTSETHIESITFRTDDFIIRFLEISVDTGFTELQITNSTLIIGGVFREFAGMTGGRE